MQEAVGLLYGRAPTFSAHRGGVPFPARRIARAAAGAGWQLAVASTSAVDSAVDRVGAGGAPLVGLAELGLGVSDDRGCGPGGWLPEGGLRTQDCRRGLS